MWYQLEKWSVLSKHLKSNWCHWLHRWCTAVMDENSFTKTSLDLVQSINTLILIWDSVVAIVIHLKNIFPILVYQKNSLWHSEKCIPFWWWNKQDGQSMAWVWCLKKICHSHFLFYMVGIVKSHIIDTLVSLSSELWKGILSA